MGDNPQEILAMYRERTCVRVLLLVSARKSFLGSAYGKESTCRKHGFNPWVGKIPWRRKWQTTPEFLPGVSHGWRSLMGYRPWVCKELDMAEQGTLSLSYFSGIMLNIFKAQNSPHDRILWP